VPDGQNVVDSPVDHQAGGEVQEHGRHHDGHEHHDLGLSWVSSHRCHLLLEEHGGAHENGCYVKWVLGRKVDDPEVERRVSQFDGTQESTVKCEKDRDLHQDRKAPASRVDLVLRVQLHDLLVKRVLVLLVAVSQGLDLGLQGGHLLHGAVADGGERNKDDLYKGAQDYDSKPVVAQVLVKVVEHVQERLGDNAEKAQVDGLDKSRGDRLQGGHLLRPDVGVSCHDRCAAGWDA